MQRLTRANAQHKVFYVTLNNGHNSFWVTNSPPRHLIGVYEYGTAQWRAIEPIIVIWMEYRCLRHIIDLKAAHDAQQNHSQCDQRDRVKGDKKTPLWHAEIRCPAKNNHTLKVANLTNTNSGTKRPWALHQNLTWWLIFGWVSRKKLQYSSVCRWPVYCFAVHDRVGNSVTFPKPTAPYQLNYHSLWPEPVADLTTSIQQNVA